MLSPKHSQTVDIECLIHEESAPCAKPREVLNKVKKKKGWTNENVGCIASAQSASDLAGQEKNVTRRICCYTVYIV